MNKQRNVDDGERQRRQQQRGKSLIITSQVFTQIVYVNDGYFRLNFITYTSIVVHLKEKENRVIATDTNEKRDTYDSVDCFSELIFKIILRGRDFVHEFI